MVTATRFSGAITSAASVKVASEPATTVPTTIWVGKFAIDCALRLRCRAHARRRTALIPTPHQIRGYRGRDGSVTACGQPRCAHRAQRSLPRGSASRLMTPDEVADESPRSKHLVIAAASIGVALTVMGIKYIAFLMTGSVALFSDALESIVNVLTAVAALIAIRIGSQPPDRGHPFGHHKAEYFSSILEGALIIVAALLIFREAFFAFLQPAHADRAGRRPAGQRAGDGYQCRLGLGADQPRQSVELAGAGGRRPSPRQRRHHLGRRPRRPAAGDGDGMGDPRSADRRRRRLQHSAHRLPAGGRIHERAHGPGRLAADRAAHQGGDPRQRRGRAAGARHPHPHGRARRRSSNSISSCRAR